ncbi:MAG: ATP-binding cassette domain-containing protein [Gammaproteobacteria bacterium]|nr:ATP-binding cassette domain-containing protein [Gammaproteobacteria bacterium]
MSTLLTLDQVSLSYGLDPLLDQIKLQINAKERICLIGRNGAGKSSLLKIVEGMTLPDTGTIWRKPNLRIARLTQELPNAPDQTIYEYVAEGLSETGKLLAQYHALTGSLSPSSTEKEYAKLERLQEKIVAANGWQFEQNISQILMRLALNPDQSMSSLSGGWQRRAALAQALVSSPELLLLDEPTNHLDIAGIEWLENELLNAGPALLFITHDRSLLQRLATRILELDRGQLTSWPGDYANFLRRKEEMLHAENQENALFDKKLAQEETWIRQGIKARRTRNEGRVRALEALRIERSKRREVQSKATFSLNEAARAGKLVVDAQNVSHCFNGQPVIDHFSIRIMRGDRIGLIGPNGIGKSTLLNILLGNLAPQEGSVTLGTKLQIAYFDQLRQALDLEKTVVDNVAEGRDSIEINGRSKHIISYLSDFLFTPARALTPVKALSGGECNRLLLARLFSKPSNLLVMDEPTNDLDIETLELLEDLLSSYQGTLLLVSHDRAFVDNVVTGTLYFQGKGRILESVGGYKDLEKNITVDPSKSVWIDNEKLIDQKNIKVKMKFGYKEQKELEALPNKLESLEKMIEQLQIKIADPHFYKQPQKVVNETLEALKTTEADLQNAFSRWEELELQKNTLQ